MNQELLVKIINQICEYKLTTIFHSPKEFDSWLKHLNNRQLNNFINLDINPNEVTFPKKLLINSYLLNCDDYKNRINALLKIKYEGNLPVFSSIASPSFIYSKIYYDDIEMISKVSGNTEPLRVIKDNSFILSPYHKEDLALIIEAINNKEDDIASALAMVAKNIHSIKSSYHKQDMQIIFNEGKNALKFNNQLFNCDIDNLATNVNSLHDKYHLENMHILAKNSHIAFYLYNLMTNPTIIKNKYYREEIDAISKANSNIKAAAMYYYIVNSPKYRINDYFDLLPKHIDLIRGVKRSKLVKDKNNTNYLKYLNLLNSIDNKIVLFIETLLSDNNFINSPNCEFDIKLLQSISNKEIFMDVYNLLFEGIFLNSKYHVSDLKMISKTDNEQIRYWLISRAADFINIDNEEYHDYDMNYITKIDLDNTDEQRLLSMLHYLINPEGIIDSQHIQKLEKLAKVKDVSDEDIILSYLNSLRRGYINDNHGEKDQQFTKKL